MLYIRSCICVHTRYRVLTCYEKKSLNGRPMKKGELHSHTFRILDNLHRSRVLEETAIGNKNKEDGFDLLFPTLRFFEVWIKGDKGVFWEQPVLTQSYKYVSLEWLFEKESLNSWARFRRCCSLSCCFPTISFLPQFLPFLPYFIHLHNSF